MYQQSEHVVHFSLFLAFLYLSVNAHELCMLVILLVKVIKTESVFRSGSDCIVFKCADKTCRSPRSVCVCSWCSDVNTKTRWESCSHQMKLVEEEKGNKLLVLAGVSRQ